MSYKTICRIMRYIPLDPEKYKKILNSEVYNIGSMEAHDCGNQSTEYIGSRELSDGTIYDYFISLNGSYWYDTRYRVKTGEIISTEERIFGHKLSHRSRRKIWSSAR